MPTSTFFNLPEEKRRRVVDAAIEEFSVYTYEQASIARIIQYASIPRGSFYQYFSDKKDLYFYLLEMIGNGKRKKLMPIMSRRQELGFYQTLKEVFQAGIEYMIEFPKYAKIAELFVIYPNQDIIEEFIGKSTSEGLNFYKELLHEGVVSGQLNPQIDIDLMADILLTITNVITEKSARESDFPTNFINTNKFEQMLDFIEHGIGRR